MHQHACALCFSDCLFLVSGASYIKKLVIPENNSVEHSAASKYAPL